MQTTVLEKTTANWRSHGWFVR